MTGDDTLTLNGPLATWDGDEADGAWVDEEHKPEALARVCVVENRFEADLLKGALEREGIPCRIEDYRDMALDGLFQLQRGWGGLVVRLSDFDRASALVADVRPELVTTPPEIPPDEPRDR